MLRCAPRAIVLAGTLLVTSSLLADDSTQDPQTQASLKFLQAIRERGYFDVALDYIADLRKDPDTPADLKTVLDYEEGRSLLAEATRAADLEVRNDQLEKARAKLAAFAKANPNHALAAEALVQLANVLTERGMTAIFQAGEATTSAEKELKLAEARGAFGQSRTAYVDAEKPLKKLFDSFPKFIPEGDPRRTERDRAHIALMFAELYRTDLDFEEAQTYPFGSKERNELLERGVTAFEDVYKRYRQQSAGIYARMMQGKCYEEQGKLTEAMGIYKELMDHTDPGVKQYQRKISYFQTIVDGKRGEHALAVDRASAWLQAYPNAHRTEEGVGVRLELAKNILAQLPNMKDSEKDLAIRRATDILTDVTRNPSRLKAEALALLKKYKPKAAANPIAAAGLSFDDAMAQGQSAVDTHEWDRAIAMFRQAVRKADPNKDIEKTNRARYLMAFAHYQAQHFYEADVLAEHIARNYPRFNQAAQAAEIGMAALTLAYNTYNKLDQKSDLDRLIDLCNYAAETWPDTTQADAARLTVGEVELGRGNYLAGAAAYEAVRQNSPKRLDALVRAGDGHWFEANKLRDQGKTAEAEAQEKLALERLDTALKARREANTPPTDLGLIKNVKALAEIHRVNGRTKEALALLEPLTQKLGSNQSAPEIAEQVVGLLTVQLRAHIANGQADQAIADMKLLETANAGRIPLTQLYLELSLTLQKELEAEKAKKYTTNLNRTKDAYLQFIQALANSKSGQTFESLAFAGQQLLSLDKPKEAEEIFDRVLKDPAMVKAAGAGNPSKLNNLKLRKAEAMWKQKQFADALALIAEARKADPKSLLPLWKEGELYEDWGRSDPKQWSKALAHWTWMSQRLEKSRNLRNEFYDSIYHVALALQGLQKKSEAKKTLEGIVALHPNVGSPELKAKYEKLIATLK
jgi:hypothetical protein